MISNNFGHVSLVMLAFNSKHHYILSFIELLIWLQTLSLIFVWLIAQTSAKKALKFKHNASTMTDQFIFYKAEYMDTMLSSAPSFQWPVVSV